MRFVASIAAALFAAQPQGAVDRANGSPFYLTKIPDLIGRTNFCMLWRSTFILFSHLPIQTRKPVWLCEGKQHFRKAGCPICHSPPLYTNNKLTLASGFKPEEDHPLRADILNISVGTDPNLALKTRKGTGFYKVPSLKGVWYRGLYAHDGAVSSLEDWFDPARLRDDYVPTGFKGYGVTTRAVKGHEFGLLLSTGDKNALIAFF